MGPPKHVRPSHVKARRTSPTVPVARGSAGEGVTVTRLNVPFGNLVTFFLKAVFAALPALIMLMVVLWTIGEVLQRYFPWLLKMRILIQFPG